MTQSSYFLAIDVGTSRVAAATARVAADGSIVAAPFTLGRRSDSAATVVFVGDDGELSFGDAAERRGVTQPERLIREFKRSVGDDVPITVGDRALRAEHLYAQTAADIVRQVAEREGAEPEGVALTHPTEWGAHRLELIRSALAAVGVTAVELISEPEAAARHYEAARPLEMGQTLAVYDLGGGTFDTVLLRKEIDGTFDIVGEPTGIEDLGGADFDDAVLRHVISASGIDVATLAMDEPDTRLALSQLRRECVDAKEALSFDSDASIPVLVPPQRTSVRLTRSEFEAMIRPSIDRTIDAVDDALESAGLEPEQLDSILLIGGSSRIPQVAQRLSERFDRPIAVDADPKAAIALGAARTALVRAEDRRVLGTPGALALIADGPSDALALLPDAPTGEAVALDPPFPVSAESSSFARKSSPILLAGAAVTIAAAIVFASTLSAGSRSPELTGFDSGTPSPTPSSSSAPATDPVAAPPLETVAETQPVADQGGSRGGGSGPSNPRRQATQRAVQQSEKQIAAASPTAKPTTPASQAQTGGGSGSGPGTPTGTTPNGNTTPSPSPTGGSSDPTTANPDPTTDPTTPPADPTADPTTPPADPTDPPADPTDPPADPTDPPADPTTPPADPSTPPADPTTPPAEPDPTTPPADPAPDPSPSPTDPV